MSLWHIFSTMVLAGLSAVGGAYGSVAVAQSAWVGPGMLPPEAFAWAVALGQITPGPLSVLVVALGWQLRGPAGAAVALLGVTLPTWLLSAFAARSLARWRESLSPYARAIGWIVAALALTTGLWVALPLRPSLLEVLGVAVCALLTATGKVEAYWLIAGGAVAGLITLLM